MNPWERLTDSEKKVIRLLAQGHSRKATGEALNVSVRTVDRHMDNIFRKLGSGGIVTILRKLYVFTEVGSENGTDSGKTHLDARSPRGVKGSGGETENCPEKPRNRAAVEKQVRCGAL